jgi:hypothetical protein
MEKDGKSGAGKEIAQEGLAADAEGYSPYVNSEHGVSLVYPEEWKKSEGYMGTIVSFLCPDDATGRTSLNLLVQEVPPGITLEDYSAESLGQMKQMMADTEFKVWDGDMFAQAGKRMQFVADMGPFTVKVFQAWTVAKDQAYILTYSAPADTHDLHREHVEKVIASTKFVKAEPKEKPIELLCLKHYENPTHAFRLRFPRTWTVKEPEREGGPVVQAKYEDALAVLDTQTYTLTADVTISTLPNESWGVEEYKDIALMRLGDLAGGEENIQLKDTKMGGQPAIQARYASPSAGTTNLHVFTVKDGKAYNIAFSTNTPKNDTRPYPIFARILSSFTILSPGYTPKAKILALEHLVHKVSFEFPEDEWLPREGMMMTTVSFEHGMTDEGAPRSNVNLVITDLNTAPINVSSLDEFASIVREQLAMAVDSLSFVHEKKVKMGGKDARELRYKGTISDREFGFQQTFTVLDNNAYVISFSSLLGDFDTEIELALPIIESFHFL